MRRRVILLFAVAVVWVAAAGQMASESRYRLILENETVRVYRLELPPGFRAPSFQNAHDVVWVALNDARVRFVMRDKDPVTIDFRAGDARFFRSFATERVVNEAAAAFRAVVVELKARGLGSLACGCGSGAERALCGCAGSPPLPELWAVGLGRLTVAGSTLAAGEGFLGAGTRDDSLLIAITPLELRDQGRQPRILQLQPGAVVWLAAGEHRWRNFGAASARFITVEF